MESWLTLISAWKHHMRSGGRTHDTIRTRLYWVHRFARDHDNPSDVTIDAVQSWMASGDWAPATLKSIRNSLRGFYRWATGCGYLDCDPTESLPLIRVAPGVPRPVAESILEVGAAHASDRDLLMLMLGSRAGLRRAEIAQCRREDLDDYGRLTIHGKGGKKRIVPLPPDLAALIRRHPPGYLFPGRWSGHMHVASVGKVIRRALNFESSAHALRHRFATRAYAGTKDLRAVQTLLGHASPVTTQVYVQVEDDALVAAVEAAA